MNKTAVLQKINEFEDSIFDLNYIQINRFQLEIINMLIDNANSITTELESEYLKAIQELSIAFENKDYLLFRDLLIYKIMVFLN